MNVNSAAKSTKSEENIHTHSQQGSEHQQDDKAAQLTDLASDYSEQLKKDEKSKNVKIAENEARQPTTNHNPTLNPTSAPVQSEAEARAEAEAEAEANDFTTQPDQMSQSQQLGQPVLQSSA